jgi:1,4-dihydroxy-2-naphthoyl-CoA hydrolase
MIWFKRYTAEDLKPYTEEQGLVKHLNITVAEIGDDYLHLRMPVAAYTMQAAGIMHGGTTCALVESAGSFASRMCLDPAKQYSVGSVINVNHLHPITDGTLIAICKPVHLGRQKHVWDIVVQEEGTDKLIAKGELTCAVQDNK